MAGALNYLPELDKLIFRDLPIMIEVDGIKEFIGRNLAESHLWPVFRRLSPIDSLISVLVENFEDILNQLSQVVCQLLHKYMNGVTE